METHAVPDFGIFTGLPRLPSVFVYRKRHGFKSRKLVSASASCGLQSYWIDCWHIGGSFATDRFQWLIPPRCVYKPEIYASRPAGDNHSTAGTLLLRLRSLPHICPGFFAVSGGYIPSRYLVLYHIFNEIASCIMIHKLSRILGCRFQALIYNADSNAYRRDRDDFTLHEYSLTFRAQSPPENVRRRKWLYRSRWSVRNPQVGNPIIQSQI